jgi:hypothetical protein
VPQASQRYPAHGNTIANYLPGISVQYGRKIYEACTNADIGDIGKPQPVQVVDERPLDDIGIPRETMP